MSNQAEELLGQLVIKIEDLEVKIQSISSENKQLHKVLDLVYKQLLNQSKKIQEYELNLLQIKKEDNLCQIIQAKKK